MGDSAFLRALSDRYYTDRAVRVVAAAEQLAIAHNHPSITPVHMLLALSQVDLGPGRLAFERLGLYLEREQKALSKMLRALPCADRPTAPAVELELQGLLAEAEAARRELNHHYVGTEHLALALLTVSPTAEFLASRGITKDRLAQEIQVVLGYKQ